VTGGNIAELAATAFVALLIVLLSVRTIGYRGERCGGGESVSQSPLKYEAFTTFTNQNPPFELRPEMGFRRSVILNHITNPQVSDFFNSLLLLRICVRDLLCEVKFAKNVLLNLAGCGLRKLVDEPPDPRDLVRGQTFSTELRQFLLGDLMPRLDLDKSDGHFAPVAIRNPDDRSSQRRDGCRERPRSRGDRYSRRRG